MTERTPITTPALPGGLPFDATQIQFTQSGTGAVARSVQSKERDVVSVFDFMTAAQIADVQARTKLVNVAAAIQAAVTALNAAANNGELWFPPGVYRIDSEITIPTNVSISIRGSGREVTVIQLNSTTQNGFNVACDQAVHFSDLQIIGSAAQTAGAGIKLNGATNGVTTNPHSSFRNLGFTQCWKGIEVISAMAWRVNGCQFFGILDAGIVAGDSVFPDSGDTFITENFFTGNSASATLDGIRHTGGGGIHIVNNAFISLGCAYRMAWATVAGSSQIRLQGNTVDQSMQVAGFLFDRTAAGGLFGISIKDNFFDTNVAAAPSIWFKTNAAGSVNLVSISGNDHLINAGNTGIQIDGGSDYSITGELFVGNANGTGIATGNATATNIYLGSNSFENVLNPYSINTPTQIRGGQFFGNTNADFGNVADGAIGTIATCTVPGAAVGDICTVGAPQLIVGGVFLYATISAANTAKVTAFNKSGGAWNVGAGLVKVFACRQEV
jgi:hypothetical protein